MVEEMFHKNFKSRCFLTKIHFVDSQINKVHSPTIFCIVPRNLMGFWDASFFPSDLMDHFCPDHMAIAKRKQSLKIEQDFEVVEPCKCNDFWHDASKIIVFSLAQDWEVSDLWR